MDNSRCVILVPATHSTEPRCALSPGQLEARGCPVRRLHGFSRIDAARNRLANDALAEGFDELMWIDSDIAFEPDSVDRLRSHAQPVVCGIYPEKGERALSSRPLPEIGQIHFGIAGGLLEICYAAAGFLHTRREVFEEIRR